MSCVDIVLPQVRVLRPVFQKALFAQLVVELTVGVVASGYALVQVADFAQHNPLELVSLVLKAPVTPKGQNVVAELQSLYHETLTRS